MTLTAPAPKGRALLAAAASTIKDHDILNNLTLIPIQVSISGVHVLADEGAGLRVDGVGSLLVGLGVLTDPLTAPDDKVEPDVQDPAVQANVGVPPVPPGFT